VSNKTNSGDGCYYVVMAILAILFLLAFAAAAGGTYTLFLEGM